MILSVDQLKKNIESTLDLELDFKSMLETSDLINDIEKVHVTGSYQFLTSEHLLFNLHVETTLTLSCAITLKPVKYQVAFDFEEEVSKTEQTEYQIQGDQIDLSEMVWGALVPEVPIAVVSEDAPEGLFDKEKEVNPAFSSLKDLLKK